MNYDGKFEPVRANDPDVASSPAEDGDTHNPLTEVTADDVRRKRRLWLLGGVVLVILVSVWFALHSGTKDGVGDGASTSQVPIVTVIVPNRSTIASEITATGTLSAIRDMPIGVVGEGGEVSRVLVEPGAWVSAGQTLAIIDSSVQQQQATAITAQIRVAQANAQLAQSNLDRARKLIDRGFISRADIDRLVAERDAASAQVRVAQAQLAETQARNRRLVIKAPAAGLVLTRDVEPGQVVSGSSGILFRIAEGGKMEMKAELSGDDLDRITTGASAKVVPTGSATTLSGTVWQVSPVIDAQSRLGLVRIAIPYTRDVRPGGFAQATLSSGTLVAPKLPESAILSDDRGSYVFIVDKNDKVIRRDVKTGDITESGIVIADGLSGDERVVLRAGAFLAAGETVRSRLVKP